jgi:ABC-type multidrug transport system ATPase subunit
MLRIADLTHVYPNGTRALDGVTLEVPRGMYGLLGPNGAGKSSLMCCIATLQIPTRGSIRFDDLDVLADPDALRRTLGYLPQDFGVYPRVSALDMLDHLAVLKGIADRGARRATVEALLHQVNLWDVRKKALAGFSGGMRQRFGIAQALIGRPSLIIVDEPTAGLDPEERNRFLNLLAEIGENVVVILSTHIVEDVADLCPNMAIIANGRIVQTGAPADLIKALDGRVWRKTIGRQELDAYRRDHEVIATRLFGGRTVIHVLADRHPGAGFEPMQGGLEDVYFSTLAATRRIAA